MKRQLPVFYILLLSAFSMNLAAQDPKASEGNSARQEQINNRWIESQPVIMVFSNDDYYIAGQPFHASIDTLYLYPSLGLPVGESLFQDLEKVAINEIDSVRLQKGGNLMTRSRSSRIYQIPKNNSKLYYTAPFQAVKTSAVYQDELVFPESIEDAFPHSKVMRQAFPKKHLRISFGVGFGGDRAIIDAQEGIESSQLSLPWGAYGQNVTVDILDISWRFMDRFIVGGRLLGRNYSGHVWGDFYDGQFTDYHYSYDMKFVEKGFYGEYAFLYPNRFFARRIDLLAGAGLLMGKPEWSIYYYFFDATDQDNVVHDEVRHEQTDNIFGFQLRTAFHYYIFPGFSLWTGLEANLYAPWTIEAVDLPRTNPDVPLHLPEHSLDFSVVRFKLGIAIYL